jgi:hypothetical protein
MVAVGLGRRARVARAREGLACECATRDTSRKGQARVSCDVRDTEPICVAVCAA